MERPVCQSCRRRPAAVNNCRGGVRRYRTQCVGCIRSSRGLPRPQPLWQIEGYERKRICDLCKFRSRYESQIAVVHIDGDLRNCDLVNLRSVCLNCLEAVKRRNPTWRWNDLELD